jgi:NitT/TauT family transport system ATP-binding protein
MTGAGGTPLVEARGLRLAYRDERGRPFVAVDDVSFELARGERLVLLGASGCGKSTLLKAVGGFLPPAAGTVRVGGRPVVRPGPDRAFVFQEFDQLFPWLTARQNVVHAQRLAGRAGRRDAEERADRFLGLMRLTQHAGRYPHALSGGMKQRVAIARALALRPDVLLMDEPFGALDAITRDHLQRELIEIWRQTAVTILFVTHSIEEAVVVGDRVLVMGPGPSSVRDVVDVRGIEDPDDHRAEPVRRRLRALLDGAAAPAAGWPA